MDGGILTLPVRAGIGSARVLLRTAGAAAGCAVNAGGKATMAAAQAASRVSDTIAWGRPASAFDAPVESHAPAESPSPEAAAPVISDLRATPSAPPRPPEPLHPREPLQPPEPPQPREPVHVSEEPELVEEVAEPGAEDGAGAAVTVDEPWSGYARMTAKQVIERLGDATPAELAAVELYESVHRNRQTVRAAAERNLKSKTGRGSPN